MQIEIVSNLAKIPPVAGNAAELREVLTNLVFNSVDAMPKGGTITLSTHEEIDGATISISDTGTGMSPEERERCLEPFFTTKGDHGTGLGLAVVYGIVQRHKGTIEITSEKNVGTTFSIRFPRHGRGGGGGQAGNRATDRTLRVLVVDDQEIICELIAEYLHSDGHTTACAFRGDEALEIFRKGTFDLVITDQAMPAMNGSQLAEAVKLHSSETPVILLTGFGDEMLAVGGHPPGVDMVLGKPISHADLRQAVFQAFNTGKKLASVA
ncbi:MAG: ATP-binding protein [Chthoniobacter sp.]